MMVNLACFFLAGIMLVLQFSVLPAWNILYYGIAGIVILGILKNWRLMFFVMGFVWALGLAHERLADRLSVGQEGVLLEIEGDVIGLPKVNDRRTRFDFNVTSPTHAFPSRIRLSWYNPQLAVKAGQKWRFAVKLKRPHGLLNPGGFDFERWLFARGIGATGYVRDKPKAVLLMQKSSWQSISVWRQNIAEQLSLQGGNLANLGLIKALTIGHKDAVSQKHWELFRRTGTVHLMAISGLHIGLVSGIIYYLVVKFCAFLGFLRIAPYRLAASSALFCALIYSALAGFSVPTLRAFMMLTVVMMATIWQRHINHYNTLAIALFVVLIVDPFAVLSYGFWLSFLAVILIIFVLSGRLKKTGFMISALKIHWISALGLAPVLLFFFQQVSLVTPIANFIAVPMISFIVVPLALMTIIIMYIMPSIAKWTLIINDQVLDWLQQVLQVMAGLPQANLNNPEASFWQLLLAVAGAIILISPKGIPGRYLGLVFFFPLLFADPNRPEVGEVKLTLLDIGQGLSAVVQTQRHNLVFDAGARYSEQFDMGSKVVLPFIQATGINTIDRLIISHGDNDHIGGAEAVINALQIKQISTSVPELLSAYHAQFCQAGQEWYWDQVKFKILSPPVATFNSENDNSCVLHIQTKNGSVLLSGDIEQRAEAWLVNTYSKDLFSEVLVAPHHGSKTSSSSAFLQYVQPQIVLIPAGYKNRFGFPDASVLNRYQQIKAKPFNVADHGAVAVTIGKQGIIVQTQRESYGKFWNFMN